MGASTDSDPIEADGGAMVEVEIEDEDEDEDEKERKRKRKRTRKRESRLRQYAVAHFGLAATLNTRFRCLCYAAFHKMHSIRAMSAMFWFKKGRKWARWTLVG